jgi:hypothetical protein
MNLKKIISSHLLTSPYSGTVKGSGERALHINVSYPGYLIITDPFIELPKYLGNGIQITHILGLRQPQDGSAFQSELTRRRFWACYLISSFAQSPVSMEPSDQMVILPLLCRDENLSQSISNIANSLSSQQGNGGIYAELVRVMRLWYAPEIVRPTWICD